MKRLVRFSFIIAIGTLIAWGFSLFVKDGSLWWKRAVIHIDRSGVALAWVASGYAEPTAVFHIEFVKELDDDEAWINLPRFTGDMYASIAYCPYWLLNLLTWSSFIFLRYRSRRLLKGHCQKCGYDLTGNVSGRCPECDTATGAAV